MGLADLVDISDRSPGVVALIGLGLAVVFTVVGYGLAWLWRRFMDPRRAG